MGIRARRPADFSASVGVVTIHAVEVIEPIRRWKNGGRLDFISPDPAVATIQRCLSRCRRGSNRYRRLRLVKAAREQRVARRRTDQRHKLSAALVATFGAITLIKPASIKEATASGRGNARAWGAAVETKADLNRLILDQAPAAFIAALQYKIDEAGGSLAVIEASAHPTDVGDAVVKTAKATRALSRAAKRAA